MPKRPRFSARYRRAVRMEVDEWTKSQVRERDEAARKAREAEKAAVIAELEKNKPRSEARTSPA